MTVEQVPDTIRVSTTDKRVDTVYVRSEVGSSERMLHDLMERQAVRDSVIIVRLTDLLNTAREETPPPPPEQRDYSVTEEPYEPTETVTSQSEVSAAEMESLRREVELLRNQLDRQSERSAGDYVDAASPNVVVVPSGGGQRDTVFQYDERQAAENQQLRGEVQRLREEVEAMRRDMRARDFLLEDYLKEKELEHAGKPLPADTLVAADTLVPPPAPITSQLDTLVEDTLRATPGEVMPEPDSLPAAADTSLIAPEAIPDALDNSDNGVDKLQNAGPALSPAGTTLEKTVFFGLNKVAPAEDQFDKLEQVATFWASHPGYRIYLKSHADNSGNREYNRALCARRNDAVKKLLVARYDVDPAAITTEVGGQIVREDARKFNPEDRRVEITVKSAE